MHRTEFSSTRNAALECGRLCPSPTVLSGKAMWGDNILSSHDEIAG
ncbi:MAG: hypothetical protein ACK5JO_18985 [Halodesulfovibrio sp.]